MDEFATMSFQPTPTAMRPLLGLTILVVEDSRYACDALRLMCLRSGARIRRADSLAAARRHLEIYRPCVVLVDMGLPDGSGAELIAELSTRSPRIPVILATSADDFSEPVAIAAGADGFLHKPHDSLAAFQDGILSHMPPDRRPCGPRAVPDEDIAADRVSYRDDLAHVSELLHRHPTRDVTAYAARFLSGIARQAHDDSLAMAASRLEKTGGDGAQITNICALIDERIVQTPAL